MFGKQNQSVVETLEGRQFLSASPAAAVDTGSDLASAGKVSMQDFHFVMKVNKASPKLFTAQDGGGDAAGISFVAKPTKHTPGLTKIKFSDILVTGKSDGDVAASGAIKFSDLLVSSQSDGDVAAAGKVSMQDFNFVMKVNKASPKL